MLLESMTECDLHCLSPAEDRLPPSVVVNKGLVLDENSMKKMTTLQLSASDQDSEPSELVYQITKQTSLGHLEHVASPGTQGQPQVTGDSRSQVFGFQMGPVQGNERER